MSDTMPWSTRASVAALALVMVTWLCALGLLAADASVGWLILALAAWFTVGLAYTALGAGDGSATD
jgi:hypothetical protein